LRILKQETESKLRDFCRAGISGAAFLTASGRIFPSDPWRPGMGRGNKMK
jgi:hypothetical protein